MSNIKELLENCSKCPDNIIVDTKYIFGGLQFCRKKRMYVTDVIEKCDIARSKPIL